MDSRRRSATAGVGGVALALTALVAIGVDSRADERAVCVDRGSDTRVADEECGDPDGSPSAGYGWYYIPSGRSAPAEGERVSGQGSFRPSSSALRGGVASDGGTVTRGGFFSDTSSFGG